MSTTTIPTSTSSSSLLAPSNAASSYFHSLVRRRQQKRMSITQTYYLAHTARRKLTREAARADHDLRLLVGHANLLDSLMLDLADAEQEQERWFNQTVSGASKSSPSPSPADAKHIQWAETVVEDPEEDWDPEDISDADSDLSDDEDFDDEDNDGIVEEEFAVTTPIRRRAPSPVISEREVQDDDDLDDSESDSQYDDGEEDLEQLTLTRSPSRQQSPPPDLSSDSDEESEDDAMPPSPPQPTFDSFAEDEKEPRSTTLPLADTDQTGLFEQGYYVPGQPQGPIIEAY